MQKLTLTGVAGAIALTILGFLLDRTGSSGFLLLASTIFLILCLTGARITIKRWPNDIILFLAGAIGACPIFLVLLTHGSVLLGGIRAAVASDSPQALHSPQATQSVPALGPPTTSAPAPTSNVTIEKPTKGEIVPVEGVTVRGRASSLREGTSLWLFLLSPDDGGRHFLTGEIQVIEGEWSLGTGQIGSKDPIERGQTYSIEVIEVTGEAAAIFRSRLTSKNGETFLQGKALPPEMKLVAERRVERG